MKQYATPARRAAYCWVRKTSAECRATKYWRYFSIAKELSLSKYTSFPWFYWIRDFVTLQNTVFLIDKSGKEIKILSPCYARRKRKKLGTHKQLQEGKRCCKVTNDFRSLTAVHHFPSALVWPSMKIHAKFVTLMDMLSKQGVKKKYWTTISTNWGQECH